MRFTLYTEQTTRECGKAIQERLAAKPTKRRPALEGNVQKGGKFYLAMTGKVARIFNRKTRLRATMERNDGVTTIDGSVNGGASPDQVKKLMAAVCVVALVMLFNGNALLGILALGFGTALYIPLTGDYDNSDQLIKEVRRACKARTTPPK